jgi:hypothetical protein
MKICFKKHFDVAEKYNLPMLFVSRNSFDDFIG